MQIHSRMQQCALAHAPDSVQRPRLVNGTADARDPRPEYPGEETVNGIPKSLLYLPTVRLPSDNASCAAREGNRLRERASTQTETPDRAHAVCAATSASILYTTRMSTASEA